MRISETQKAVPRMLAIALTFFILVKLSYLGTFIPVGPAPIWMPSGFALAILLMRGMGYWPAIAFGSLMATLLYEAPPFASLMIMVAHVTEATLGAFVMLRLLNFQVSFVRLKDVLALLFAGAIFSTAVNSTISITSLCVLGVLPWKTYGEEWFRWWTPAVLSDLILTPLILVWKFPWEREHSLRAYGEFAIAMLASLPMVYFVFFGSLGKTGAFAYGIYPFVIWIAIRSGMWAAIVANFLYTSLAIWSAAIGKGPFLGESSQESLFFMQAFLVLTAVTGMSLAAFATERSYLTRLLESVLQQSPVGILLVNAGTGRLISINSRIQEIFKISIPPLATIEDLRRLLAAHHLDGRPIQPSEWPLARSLLHGEPVHGEELELLRGDGTPCIVEVSSVPVRNDQGKVVAGISIIEDVTDLHRTRLEREDLLKRESESRQRAEAAIRVREDFMSIASHELKTPLTPLKLQLQLIGNLLRSGAIVTHSKAKALPKLVADSDLQIGRLTRLIEDMLDVSRIRTGKLSLNVEEVDLSKLISEVIDRFETELQKARSPVSGDFEPDIQGQWDRLRVEQVVINLLTNAMKYGAGKPIQMTLRRIDNRAQLSVHDSGIGIAKENQERIFEPFERAVSVSSFGGMGLGLFIVRQIVQAHGGSIQVDSDVGMGSTFIVYLPLMRSVTKAA